MNLILIKISELKMGSRSKKMLMMLNEENNLKTKTTDTNSNRSFREGDVGHKSAAISIKNSSMCKDIVVIS